MREHCCPVCSKTFITSSDLSRHLATHTGIRNYQCDICTKAFSRNRDMVMHKRKIHLNDRTTVTSFKCSECRRVFPDGESLQLHVSKDHVHQVPIVAGPPEIPPNIDQHPIHHNIPGPHHHLHHAHHHQALIQLPPPGMGYPHQRLHPY